MKLDFYGVNATPPTIATAEAFGSSVEPVRLAGGQGTTYRAGEIVLKPAEGDDGGAWAAELFDSLPESADVRFARPIKSVRGSWIHDGYVAWSFLSGDHIKGQYGDKLKASRAFHSLLSNAPKPLFVGSASSSWLAADLVVWQKREFDYGPEFAELISQITPYLKPYDAPSQLIHGDLSGNLLVADGLPVAVIDFSPAWAPSGFAEGIMLVDAITWEDAQHEDLKVFEEIPDIDQLAWRGVFRRIAEQAEHITWFDKDKDQALQEARAFEKAIAYLKANFAYIVNSR